MRLTSVLLTWPKKRPRGFIWIGADQMVRKVQPWHLRKMQQHIEMEKRNTMICLNPYVTPEQERIAAKARSKTELREDQILFR